MTFARKNGRKDKDEKGSRRPAPYHIEIMKSGKRVTAVVSGVMAVSDFSPAQVALVSHGGKIKFSGEGLSLSVFENKTVEITGRVENISLE